MIETIVSAEKSIFMKHNYSAINTLKTTDGIRRYHIGRRMYIPDDKYNGLINSCKTPSLFAGGLMTAVFLPNELLTSTISGFLSRRTGRGRVECTKLDPVRVGACKDFYLSPHKELVSEIPSEAARFYKYARSKIAELKRIPTNPRRKEKNDKGKKNAHQELKRKHEHIQGEHSGEDDYEQDEDGQGEGNDEQKEGQGDGSELDEDGQGKGSKEQKEGQGDDSEKDKDGQGEVSEDGEDGQGEVSEEDEDGQSEDSEIVDEKGTDGEGEYGEDETGSGSKVEDCSTDDEEESTVHKEGKETLRDGENIDFETKYLDNEKWNYSFEDMLNQLKILYDLMIV